jgi:hypothetical protein
LGSVLPRRLTSKGKIAPARPLRRFLFRPSAVRDVPDRKHRLHADPKVLLPMDSQVLPARRAASLTQAGDLLLSIGLFHSLDHSVGMTFPDDGLCVAEGMLINWILGRSASFLAFQRSRPFRTYSGFSFKTAQMFSKENTSSLLSSRIQSSASLNKVCLLDFSQRHDFGSKPQRLPKWQALIFSPVPIVYGEMWRSIDERGTRLAEIGRQVFLHRRKLCHQSWKSAFFLSVGAGSASQARRWQALCQVNILGGWGDVGEASGKHLTAQHFNNCQEGIAGEMCGLLVGSADSEIEICIALEHESFNPYNEQENTGAIMWEGVAHLHVAAGATGCAISYFFI